MKKAFLVCLMCVVFALTTVLAIGCTPKAVEPESITVSSKDNVTEIEVGQTLQLTAVVAPEGAPQEVTWSSGDSSKATVDGNGLVTAVSKGNVVITATSASNDKITKTFALIINEQTQTGGGTKPQSVVLTTPENVTSVAVGATLKISATVLPANASQEVEWSSDDESVATVNNGVVTGVAKGDANITATCKGETVKSSLKITVTEESVPSNDYESMAFTNHADYISADKGTVMKVKGVVTYILPETNGAISYYIQNGNDAFYIYQQDAAKFPVELGKVYAVGGVKDLYRTGTHQLKTIEYCEKLSENLTFNKINLNDKDVSSAEDMLAFHGAVVTGTAEITSDITISTKTYSINVEINGKATTLCVNPSNMSADEFTEISGIFENAVKGVTVEFTGVMTAYGNGNYKAPQILLMKSTEFELTEAAPSVKVELAKDAVFVVPFVSANANTITLPTSVAAFDDVVLSWSSDNTAIAADGTVVHPETDTVVTLTVTATHKTDSSVSAQKSFKVNVAGTTFENEKLASLNLEDASDENMQYGCSPTKSGYLLKDENKQVTVEANTITLGEPSLEWVLWNALIAGPDGGDHCDGKFAIRTKAGKDHDGTGRIELLQSGEYNYVQFDAAVYNSQALGICVGVEYKMENGETWVDSGFVAKIMSYELTTYRFKLPEGVKNVAIYVVENSGNTVNIDNIELYK